MLPGVLRWLAPGGGVSFLLSQGDILMVLLKNVESEVGNLRKPEIQVAIRSGVQREDGS